MKICYLDFEFNQISEPKLNLVSVAAYCTVNALPSYERQFWLYNHPRNQAQAKAFFEQLIREGYIFVAYVVEAEARSLLSLGINLDTAQAIDLYLEYRNLTNHNHTYAYGTQLINGNVIETKPPKSKWEQTEEDTDQHHKPSHSLASATFKLLGITIDTKEKDIVRNVIIAGDAITENASRIMEYNASDIKHLQALLFKFLNFHLSEGWVKEDYLKAALSRGDYAIRTAKMLALGYPVNLPRIQKFQSNLEHIVTESVKDCLAHKPDAFRLDKKTKRYIANEKAIRAWVLEQKKPYWRKTEKGKESISRDAFKDWFDSTSDGFAGAFCRHLRTRQSLNGFALSESKRGKFTDFVGKDGRVRPYFGIYGSQSSRSQPGAVGFLPLKAHWMRVFIEAATGKAIVGIDYGSQEFLIAAILSQDAAMLEAYRSGDVYIAFAAEAKLAPKGATKQSHPIERNICKTLVLGLSYDMSAKGLAGRLSAVSKRVFTEDEAQGLIDTFFEVYSDYKYWKDQVQVEYKQDNCLSLPDGWTMWGDNDNYRSVGNFPIQGHGAVIMREAVKLSQKRKLNVIYTLHDAIYVEFDAYDFDAIATLQTSMQDAFQTVMKPYGDVLPINLEGYAWSEAYTSIPVKGIEGVSYGQHYVDDKGKADLIRYKKFI